ncbi:MAG: hypothetical protein OMM_10827 [Candidatus Magnetoglobus multicellularis str. Araruama]|uniref:Uncharacterized protein n=1 Tax=Candidatus Magnetoglobus multicellularis str. Araruama TaxID=890399 RepID=A0A1V1NZW5_9BACT|nr:MAG: hypothetical protein OMM_10827 [Candidatus Magnetoglobus multicellularis str. Araruama]
MQSINLSPQLLKQLFFITEKKNAIDAIKSLINNEVRRKINKYEYLIRNFEQKYKMTFEAFEKEYLHNNDHSVIEQDYFDWDMAVTVLADIHEYIDG